MAHGSTSGVWATISSSSGGFFPLGWTSRKQSAVSHSTPEAEIVSADLAVHSFMIPLISVFKGFNTKFESKKLFEDNETAEGCLQSGTSKSMQLLPRTHAVNLMATKEAIEREGIRVCRATSEEQVADILTKAYSSPLKWLAARRHLGLKSASTISWLGQK